MIATSAKGEKKTKKSLKTSIIIVTRSIRVKTRVWQSLEKPQTKWISTITSTLWMPSLRAILHLEKKKSRTRSCFFITITTARTATIVSPKGSKNNNSSSNSWIMMLMQEASNKKTNNKSTILPLRPQTKKKSSRLLLPPLYPNS